MTWPSLHWLVRSHASLIWTSLAFLAGNLRVVCFTFEGLLHPGATGRSYRELIVWLQQTGRLRVVFFDEADHLVPTSWRLALRSAKCVLLLLEVGGEGSGGEVQTGGIGASGARPPLRVVDASGALLSSRPPATPSVLVYLPSATIPDDIIARVAENLGLPRDRIHLIRLSTDRPNLSYAVVPVPLSCGLAALVLALFRKAAFVAAAIGFPARVDRGRRMKSMVFTHTRKETETLAKAHNETDWLVQFFGRAVPVHSGLEGKDDNLEAWRAGRADTLVVYCTQTLGFGLNADDVNLIALPKPYLDILENIQVIGRAGRGPFRGLGLWGWNPALLATSAIYWGGPDGPGGVQIRQLAQFLDGSGCRRDVLTAAAGSPRTPCSGCDSCTPALASDSAHPASVVFLTDAVARAYEAIGSTEVLLWSTFVARVQARFAEAPAIDDMVANRAVSYLMRVGDVELLHHQPGSAAGWAPTVQVRVRPSRRSEHAVPSRPRLAACIPSASTAGPVVRGLLDLSLSEVIDVSASVELLLAGWSEQDDVDGFLRSLDVVAELP